MPRFLHPLVFLRSSLKHPGFVAVQSFTNPMLQATVVQHVAQFTSDADQLLHQRPVQDGRERWLETDLPWLHVSLDRGLGHPPPPASSPVR
ncbi:hypothetical protein SAMN06265222_102496 [Neorhodopirellula lusitana]|uniref:Uncharacterized protein n=1 Tax=Neorhodopirellula lusitana TaxID=445327 RepID=A0ABY1PUQ8_9BACT|nr:hypothetical protein SAMN06265222_102496 [Neorhodopirellula lusitana]